MKLRRSREPMFSYESCVSRESPDELFTDFCRRRGSSLLFLPFGLLISTMMSLFIPSRFVGDWLADIKGKAIPILRSEDWLFA